MATTLSNEDIQAIVQAVINQLAASGGQDVTQAAEVPSSSHGVMKALVTDNTSVVKALPLQSYVNTEAENKALEVTDDLKVVLEYNAGRLFATLKRIDETLSEDEIDIPEAGANTSGLLTSADYNRFAGKAENAFLVNVTKVGDNYTMDKAMSAITAAVSAGRLVQLAYSGVRYDYLYDAGAAIVFQGINVDGELVTWMVRGDSQVAMAAFPLANKNGDSTEDFAAKSLMVNGPWKIFGNQPTDNDLHITHMGIGNEKILPIGKSGEIAFMSDIAGQLKRDLYTQFGAVYNATSGYWELNGLTDITDAQMDAIFVHSHDFRINALLDNRFAGANIRTNLWPYKYPYRGVSQWRPGLAVTNISATNMFCYCGAEVVKVAQYVDTNLTYVPRYSDTRSMFYEAANLKTIVGAISLEPITNAANVGNMFRNASALETVNIYRLGVNISFADSPNLTRASVAFMISNAQSAATVVITLHATAFTDAVKATAVHTALKAMHGVSITDGTRTADYTNIDQWNTDDDVQPV